MLVDMDNLGNRTVLRALVQSGGHRRQTDLADAAWTRHAGTISAQVTDLERRGVLQREAGRRTERRGRPSPVVRLEPDALPLFLGLSLVEEESRLYYAVTDVLGRVHRNLMGWHRWVREHLDPWREAKESASGASCVPLRDLVVAALSECEHAADLRRALSTRPFATAVTLYGQIDAEVNVVRHSRAFRCLEGRLDLATELRRAVKEGLGTGTRDLVVENEVRAVAITAGTQSALCSGLPELDLTHSVIVKLYYGIGSAELRNGVATNGAQGRAGELGHATVDYTEDALQCRCSRFGCAEAYVPASATDAAADSAGAALHLATALGRALGYVEAVVAPRHVHVLARPEHLQTDGFTHACERERAERSYSGQIPSSLSWHEYDQEQSGRYAAAVAVHGYLDGRWSR